ncbi:MAG: DNA-directed RNA polymerase subunit beta [Bradymonadaceae bacterium]
MGKRIKPNFRMRKDFGDLEEVADTPNLLDVQKRSFQEFLQSDVDKDERDEDVGLQGVFNSVFPIKDFNETCTLEFISYELGEPKYDVDECEARGMTYAAPVKVTIRLVVWDVDEETETRTIRDVKEKEVFFGELPLMTDTGSFIINGTERVIVNQLHRSPGAYFDHDEGDKQSSGKLLYSGRIIPYRGSWLDFEFNKSDILHVRIDRKRKMPATVLLKALGYSDEELLEYYYDTETIHFEDGEYFKEIDLDVLRGQEASVDVTDDEGEVIVPQGKKFTRASIRKMSKADIERVPIAFTELLDKIAADRIVDEETGEVLVEVNERLTEEAIHELVDRDIDSIKVLFIDEVKAGPYLRDTLMADDIEGRDEAIMKIYKQLRPGDPPTEEEAEELFQELFFDPERYDLSKVGRLKLNDKFHRDTVEPLEQRERQLEDELAAAEDEDEIERLEEELEEVRDKLEPWRIQTLREEDILECVQHLIDLRDGEGEIDDIDHLGNRRVRTIGELLENQYRIGLVRMERGIKERMSMSQEIETLMPDDLINSKPVNAVLKEYFGSSQLSQFMDQTNPESEVTHKRRMSALGPGGLTRDRAGFEVRDVHQTHYGRICPIETPEGPNIGLIVSLATYAKVNEYGFIETPYRRVENGVATEDVRYYSALEEEHHVVAQANTELDDDGTILEDEVAARRAGEPVVVDPEDVTLMDVSPAQLVSISASMIPFLENDDANRALMGSNMQRQAQPLVKRDAPYVGTGMEAKVARDSLAAITADNAGVIESVDAERVVVRPDSTDEEDELFAKPDIYKLDKFRRSNQGSAFTQKPIVDAGDHVEEGEVIADGPSTANGDLALGRNIEVAFMAWEGYNFEDAIAISEELVKDDIYTSIHIEEYEASARDTKLGQEEITRDIPNVGEDALSALDDSGIVRVGAEVEDGDILVGKVTPKGETQLSPEEKLLRAIFGEKAGEVRDTSKKMPPGEHGTVIGAKVFHREGAEKDKRTQEIEDDKEAKLLKDQNDEIRILRDAAYRRMADILEGKAPQTNLVDESGTVLVEEGTELTEEILEEVPRRYWTDFDIDEETNAKLMEILGDVEDQILVIRMNYGEKIEKLRQGDELEPGVIKMVKVYVAIKRKIEVGDKLANRHGNKGVISRVLPEEDMPFKENGEPVDMLLNPLGVPSRMNSGQVLETHLGWAARGLGEKIGRMLDEMTDASVMRDFLAEIYDSPQNERMIEEMDDDDVQQMARNIADDDGVLTASPVFDGPDEEEIRDLIELADFDRSGQATLYDGRTGEPFGGEVTVGIMYINKLHHLVDDKVHARSIGPYSLVTQQPLGGKAQFGGQRLGEMEVWAMEAYGAAYALQEFLTVKSDDVQGRTRVYENIVKGNYKLNPGMPESFNVLVKELHSLCLNVELLEDAA